MKKLFCLLILLSLTTLYAKTYAIVDGYEVTNKDLEAVIQQSPASKMIMAQGGIEKLPKEQLREIIDMVIDNRLLVKKAINEGVEKDKKYQKMLDEIKNSLVLDIYLKSLIAKITIKEKDIKSYYSKNKSEFTTQEDERRARHILLKSQKEADEIVKILQKAKDVKSKFIELAKSRSIGPSAKTGGDLGWFSQKKMVPAFSISAFSIKKGTFTKKPVKTKFGYHVIYVEDIKKKGTLASFDSVKDRIKRVLESKEIKELFDGLKESVRKKAKIIYKD
jgi:parvulin-like peptidyl-prolyl isomerase